MRRSVLVTGAASGIGQGIAERLASDGHQVGVLDRNHDSSHATVERITSAGGSALALIADVTLEAEIHKQVAAFAAWSGGIDGLVNNAGGFTSSDTIDRTTAQEWDDVMAHNLRGPFLCTRAVVDHLRRSPCARVVNIASVAARTAIPGSSLPYSAAKAGLLGFTRRISVELAPDGIAVNAVAPGVVDTDRVRSLHGESLAAIRESVPAGRLANVEEIAAMVAFLLGPDAGYLVGATLDVNGGRVPV